MVVNESIDEALQTEIRFCGDGSYIRMNLVDGDTRLPVRRHEGARARGPGEGASSSSNAGLVGAILVDDGTCPGACRER